MCTAYWNLRAEFICPNCGENTEAELQTHWVGEDGSCLNHYRLGQKVYELNGISAAVVDGCKDDFIGHCTRCDSAIYFGARIADEAVIEIWPLLSCEIGVRPVLI